MRNKEETILEELMDAIKKVMVCFDEIEASQQKEEQERGLDLIRSLYKNGALKKDTLYFIGRFKVIGNLNNALPGDYGFFRKQGYEMVRMNNLKQIIEKHIAKEIGLVEVDIQHSRDKAMVKVYVSGEAIYHYIAKGLKLASFSLLLLEDTPLVNLLVNINDTMIHFNEESASLQNIEHNRGLNLILSKYLADEIQETQEFFIGRYCILNANLDTLADDIARKIGVSSVTVAPSRNDSMVKVFISGEVILEYIGLVENSLQSIEL